MIPQRNISLLSNRLARSGGRRIPEAVLERDYCLAWFLVGLSRTSLKNRLAFKGGTALKRCYFGDYRFSEDLDFTLTDEVAFETIRSELESVFEEVRRASGIVFSWLRDDRRSHINSHTFYLTYEGPLPTTGHGRQVKVDITIRERLVFPLEERPVLRGYDEYEDLPTDSPIRVYSLDEIATEKVAALGDRARNEPRDLYDIWYLLSHNHVDLASLRIELEQKLQFRDRTIGEFTEGFLRKEARYKKLWDARLSMQMAELPQYGDVFRLVRREFRKAGLL